MSLTQIHLAVTANTGQSVGVQSLIRTLFLLPVISIYIFSYIDLSVLAQTLTPCEACLPLYVEGLISLPSTYHDVYSKYPEGSWAFHPHQQTCRHDSLITRVSLIKTYCHSKENKNKWKNPLPYIAFALGSAQSSQCQVLTSFLLLPLFNCSNVRHMWDFEVRYDSDALMINVMCHGKIYSSSGPSVWGVSSWRGSWWLMPGWWGNKAVLGTDRTSVHQGLLPEIPMTQL